MAYDYSLSLEKVSYYPQLNGCDKVVKHVDWFINIFDTAEPDITVSTGVITELDTSNVSPDTFSDWSSVTQTMILEWCLNEIGGVSFIERMFEEPDIQQQLDMKTTGTLLVEADVSEIPEE